MNRSMNARGDVSVQILGEQSTQILAESSIQEKDLRYKNVVSDSRRKYSGYFLGSLRDGKGREEDMQKHTMYEGYFKDDNYHGEGILYQQQTKCYFKGIFEANSKASGIEIMPNGDIYEGEYKNNLFHGRGYLRNSDFYYLAPPDPQNLAQALIKSGHTKVKSTYSYKGQFSEGKKHGFGEEIYLRGARYNGEFRNNLRHGKGKLTLQNKSYYEGDFLNGAACGFGVHVAYSLEQISQIKPIETQNNNNNTNKIEKPHHLDRPKTSQNVNSKHSFEQLDEAYNISYNPVSDISIFHRENQIANNLQQTSLNRLVNPSEYMNNQDSFEEDSEDELNVGALKRDEYYYEGEFIEGFKHGVGRLYYPDGSYYYCQWEFNKKISDILFYDAPSHSHSIFRYKVEPSSELAHFFPLQFQYISDVDFSSNYLWEVKQQPGYPPNEKDCFKMKLDECAINGDQFEDQAFPWKGSTQNLPPKVLADIGEMSSFQDTTIKFIKLNESFLFSSEDKNIFEDAITPNSIRYNHLSDYQLIACIESLTQFSHVFFKIFTPRFDFIDVGYLILKLYRSGKWQDIIMDDFLPFYNGGNDIVFSTTFRQDLGWVFLQKAFCKLNRSYFYHYKYNEKEIRAEDYLQTLTGLPSKVLTWNTARPEQEGNSSIEEEVKKVTNILKEKEKCSKLAYLNAKTAHEPDMNIPMNYPFIVLDTIDCSDNSENQEKNLSEVFVVMKSINPHFSKIKRKFQPSNPTIHPKVKEQIAFYSKTTSEDVDLRGYFASRVFYIDLETFLKIFKVLVVLIGSNQHFQSSKVVSEQVSVQNNENKYFFSFSLNLPARILINVEQHFLNLNQNLPLRIVLAQDKTGKFSSRIKSDIPSAEASAANTKKEFLRRKILKKLGDFKSKSKQKGKQKLSSSNNNLPLLKTDIQYNKLIKSLAPEPKKENSPILRKKYHNFIHIFGKGQLMKKNVFKTISLKEGSYILMVQMEGIDLEKQSTMIIKDLDLRLVVNIFGHNLIGIDRIQEPDGFIRKVYEACIHQAEKLHIKQTQKRGSTQNQQQQLPNSLEALSISNINDPSENLGLEFDMRFQKSDLGDRENGSQKIVICQFYLHSEGTYLQLLDNRTLDKRWRQKLYFNLKNMKIFESNEISKVDIHLTPQTDSLIIIQQIKGLPYHLEGGEGVCLIENIFTANESEDEEIDEDI